MLDGSPSQSSFFENGLHIRDENGNNEDIATDSDVPSFLSFVCSLHSFSVHIDSKTRSSCYGLSKPFAEELLFQKTSKSGRRSGHPDHIIHRNTEEYNYTYHFFAKFFYSFFRSRLALSLPLLSSSFFLILTSLGVISSSSSSLT